jgi:hypothetical protein
MARSPCPVLLYSSCPCSNPFQSCFSSPSSSFLSSRSKVLSAGVWNFSLSLSFTCIRFLPRFLERKYSYRCRWPDTKTFLFGQFDQSLARNKFNESVVGVTQKKAVNAISQTLRIFSERKLDEHNPLCSCYVGEKNNASEKADPARTTTKIQDARALYPTFQ